jgi:hypothetical protein
LAGAFGLLGSMALPWTRLGGQLDLSALMTAQLFQRAFGPLLFLLLAAALVTLLRPAHNMRLLAALCSCCALPLWLAMGAMTVVGVQHESMAAGFYLSGLCCAALCAAGAAELLPQLRRPAAAPAHRRAPTRACPSHCSGMPLG